MNQNLRQKYKETVVPMLMEQFKYKNIHEVPKITKITINQGLGDASKNNKALESSIREIATITGQKPVITKARKSLAGFKIRGGMPVGLAVTLRSKMMYSFLERFVKKRGGYSQKLTVGELETQVLVSLDDYDVALAELEDFLRKEGLCNQTLTAQNLVNLVKKALHKSAQSSSIHDQQHQLLNERESEILAYHGGENDDELSDFVSHLGDWYKD